MSGRNPPPRPRPRVVPPAPVQPYPPASDYTLNGANEPPAEQLRLEDELPFNLASDQVPTMRDLSVQIGAVDRRLRVVHREGALTRKELGELREYVMGDHAPRISDVERRLPPIPPGLKKGAAYGAVAAAWPLLEWAVPLVQKWFESR